MTWPHAEWLQPSYDKLARTGCKLEAEGSIALNMFLPHLPNHAALSQYGSSFEQSRSSYRVLRRGARWEPRPNVNDGGLDHAFIARCG